MGDYSSSSIQLFHFIHTLFKKIAMSLMGTAEQLQEWYQDYVAGKGPPVLKSMTRPKLLPPPSPPTNNRKLIQDVADKRLKKGYHNMINLICNYLDFNGQKAFTMTCREYRQATAARRWRNMCIGLIKRPAIRRFMLFISMKNMRRAIRKLTPEAISNFQYIVNLVVDIGPIIRRREAAQLIVHLHDNSKALRRLCCKVRTNSNDDMDRILITLLWWVTSLEIVCVEDAVFDDKQLMYLLSDHYQLRYLRLKGDNPTFTCLRWVPRSVKRLYLAGKFQPVDSNPVVAKPALADLKEMCMHFHMLWPFLSVYSAPNAELLQIYTDNWSLCDMNLLVELLAELPSIKTFILHTIDACWTDHHSIDLLFLDRLEWGLEHINICVPGIDLRQALIPISSYRATLKSVHLLLPLPERYIPIVVMAPIVELSLVSPCMEYFSLNHGAMSLNVYSAYDIERQGLQLLPLRTRIVDFKSVMFRYKSPCVAVANVAWYEVSDSPCHMVVCKDANKLGVQALRQFPVIDEYTQGLQSRGRVEFDETEALMLEELYNARYLLESW